MTDEKTRIEEIAARLATAVKYAPGPWTREGVVVIDAYGNHVVEVLLDTDELIPIYAMIAAAPTDIKWLLEKVEKLTWENRLKIQEYILLSDDDADHHFADILDHQALIPAALAIRQHLNAWEEKWRIADERASEYAQVAGERQRGLEGLSELLSAQVLQLRQQLDEAQKHTRKDAVPATLSIPRVFWLLWMRWILSSPGQPGDWYVPACLIWWVIHPAKNSLFVMPTRIILLHPGFPVRWFWDLGQQPVRLPYL